MPQNINVRLVNTRGTANKFWEIEVKDKQLIRRWGRIGSKGQAANEVYPLNDAALLFAYNLIKKKLAEGYIYDTPQKVVQTEPVSNSDGKRAAEAIKLFAENTKADIPIPEPPPPPPPETSGRVITTKPQRKIRI